MHLNRKFSRVFYGWWIVGAGFFVSLYTGGVIFFGFTAMFEPIANEFGWSYTQISLAASLRGLEIGLLAPLIGLLVDRWGPRRLMFGGVTVIGLGLMLLSRTMSLSMFYSAFALVAIGLSGCSGTVLMTAVANWFRREVAIATGILSSGFALGGLLVPLVAVLIAIFGWRTAAFSLGLGMWIIGLPLSLLVRHKPEQYGYQLDGKVNDSVILEGGVVPVQTAEVCIGARQAVKSSTFWHIALALAFQFLMVGGVVTHIMPYLSSIGVGRTISSLVASGIPLLSVIGRLGCGRLADRVSKRRLAAGCFMIMSLGLLCFGYVGTGRIWLLVPFIILFGISYGSLVIMRVVLLREHFGRANFGTIHGFTIGVVALGHVSGALLPGWVYDNWGSYQVIWLVFAGFAVVALIIVATTPPIKTTTRMDN